MPSETTNVTASTAIPDWHERILTEALNWRKAHPDFTFSLRTTDVTTQERMKLGYWFPGSNRYLWFPPFRVNDPNNKTKTIGFVIAFGRDGRPRRTYLSIVFGSVKDPGVRSVHQELVARLGPFKQMGSADKYQRRYEAADPMTAFRDFLATDYPRIRAVIEEKGASSTFVVTEQDFRSMFDRIQEIRKGFTPGHNDGGKTPHQAPPSVAPARNLILYGPPGTGKTHWLREQLRAYTERPEHVDKDEWLRQQVSEFGWRPVIAAAMAQMDRPVRVPEIRDHPWIVAKTLERGRDAASVHPTIWGFLMEHTPEDVPTVKYASRRLPFIFTKSEESLWSLLEDWQEQDPESAKLHALLAAGPSSHRGADVRRYRVVTFHPSYSYEDFVRGIRPVASAETGETAFRVVDGVFKQICDEARKNPSKRYALFIDEINRANIAKVFGELITLLEPDKRAVYDETGKLVGGMTVQLPGSAGADVVEEPFGVPSNLDVYGTMNTADRSIALLDVALRRRFEFEEMLPNYSVLSSSVEGVDIGRLLLRVNDRLEYLLDRDHRIGHAYLIGVKSLEDLRRAFELQIIPLLQEYFFDDFARVAMVLTTPPGVPPFVRVERITQRSLFRASVDGSVPPDRVRYSLTRPEGWTAESFAGLYATPESGNEHSAEAGEQ